MSVKINTLATDLATANKVMIATAPKAERLQVVALMVNPNTTDEEREDFTVTYTPGYVRRGFRQMALRLEKAGNQDVADVFWALRDDIDIYDGTVEFTLTDI